MKNKFCSLFLTLIFFLTASVFAQEHEIQIDSWLLLGPVEIELPVYHDVRNIKNETFTINDLLHHDPLDITHWMPENGKTVQWSASRQLTWASRDNDILEFIPADIDNPAIVWSAFYMDSGRFSEATLTIQSHHPFAVYVNGTQRGLKAGSENADNEAGNHTEKLVLTQGKHLILVRSVYNPENDAAWTISGTISSNADAEFTQSLNPLRFLDLETLSNQPQLGSLGISSDGSLASMRINFPSPPDGEGDSWLEIRETATGNLHREYKGGKDFGSLQWVPEGRKFTYTESVDGKTTLWLADLETGSQDRLLKDVSDFGTYRWAPDGSFIIYTVSERPDSDDSGVRLLNDLEERRPWHFTRSFLFKLNVPEGTTRRLTAGLLTTSLHDISPDGNKLLYSRSHIDYSIRPYTVTEYQLLDIQTMTTDSLFTVPFGGSGRLSPDGRTILFTGGPSMFGAIGTNVPDGMVANDYDTQAYLYDIASNVVTPISLDFDPAIDQALWGGDSNTIYLITTDRSYSNLYRYDVRQQRFSKVNTETEVVQQLAISRNGNTVVYSGTGISRPVQAYTLDLRRDRTVQLRNPGSDYFRHVVFGDDKSWAFTTSAGRNIDGFVYYPPDFDPENTYPVIAYYYGGTVPVNRAFGGRYPKELYAAKGYMVYVMQPSGATGYGQEFSALHVNDWGIIVADEIIEGVNQFLDAHPYADRERVGAIGASYGGFMTMLLMTRTDIFAAGVSHAGISNIASYWGEGFWGFQYSAIATAYSFPWNREDIYVGQSPLYSADQVRTPLLFLTGMDDTNVPAGESLQMYTALKLLGKETAFIAVDNQDHHILDYNKYKLWKESILSWFDKYLKDQPEWWEYKYGD